MLSAAYTECVITALQIGRDGRASCKGITCADIVSIFWAAERGEQVSVVCIAMGEGSVWFIKYIQVRRTTAATHLPPSIYPAVVARCSGFAGGSSTG